MIKNIVINKQKITLDPAQLIQSGGEGMVFGVGDTAVKLYHQPTTQRTAKLRCLLDSGLAAQMPEGILGPTALVMNQDGRVVGFQMPRLPAGSLPLKKLSNPHFWQKNKPPLTAILDLFQQIHATLARLHQLGIVVGDLNDHNLYFTPHASRFTPLWIDVDSYQFGGYPCPVALQSFLDPALYGVADLGKRPYFTPLTDWYAFTVLLVKSLLQVHPYGGAHKQYKSLLARAKAGVSVLDTAVTYPQSARPLNTLSDEVRHQIHLIFEQGQRHPFPVQLLASQHFSHQPVSAPTSSLQSPVSNLQSSKLLLAVNGVIEHVAITAHGRIWAIVREEADYRLVRLGVGGKLDEMALFKGQPGYRFGIFDHYLAINPPQGRQLLILDIGGRQPQKVTMIETALFRETAVFAATSQHLYRIAGTWIMRGSVQNGLYVEDAIATAHRNQTCFWASPHTETLAGYHRIFDENRFFLIHDGGSYDIPIPPLAQGESLVETAVTFTSHALAIQLGIRHKGQMRTDTYLADLNGQLRANTPTLPPPNVLFHSEGMLHWEPAQLTFIPH